MVRLKYRDDKGGGDGNGDGDADAPFRESVRFVWRFNSGPTWEIQEQDETRPCKAHTALVDMESLGREEALQTYTQPWST